MTTPQIIAAIAVAAGLALLVGYLVLM